MITLVAAQQGGGGDGPLPVFITVPWSPDIAARGQLPGSVYRSMIRLNECVQKHGGWSVFRGMSDTGFFIFAMAVEGYGFTCALGAIISRHLLLDLGIVDGAGPRT